MTIVKLSKNSNLQRLLRKSFPHFGKNFKSLVATMILSSLIGSYLDLFLVGKGLYSFPKRPFPEVFSIHIGFTLIALPLFVGVFIMICDKLKKLTKALFALLVSLCMTVLEKLSEHFDFFAHHDSWNHLYSTFGYAIYLIETRGWFSRFSTKQEGTVFFFYLN